MMTTSKVANDALDSLKVALVLGRNRLVRLGTGRCLGQDASLQDAAAVVSRATIVKALADDLSSLDDDAAMAVMKSGQDSLVKTKIQILVGLHCGGLRLRLRLELWESTVWWLLERWADAERWELGFGYLRGEFFMLFTIACLPICVFSRARGTFDVGCRREEGLTEATLSRSSPMTAGGQCIGPLATGQGSCKWQGFD